MDYPVLSSEISPDEFRDHFTITQEDNKLLARMRGVHRLGLAVLLKVHQRLGYALRRKEDVPNAVVEWLAEQLLLDPCLFERYPSSERTWRKHEALVREHLGVRFLDLEGHDAARLNAWLVGKAYQSPARKELLEHAVLWCREQRVELPTEERLRRLVNSARSRFFEQLYAEICSRFKPETRARMWHCLTTSQKDDDATDDPAATTVFDWLKSAPGQLGMATILDEIAKLRHIRTFGITRMEHFKGVGLEVIALLRDRARVEDAAQMRRHPRATRVTLLAALLQERETEVTDHIVQILLDLIRKIDRKAEKAIERTLVRNVRKVWGKKQLLYRIAIAATAKPDDTVRNVVYPEVGEDVLARLVEEAREENTDYDAAKSEIVQRKYRNHYRRMMKPVLDALCFRSDNPAHKPLLKGIELVRRYLKTKHTFYPENEEIPEQLLTGPWRDIVFETGPSGPRAAKHPFEVCVLTKLERALKCKEVWVEGAYRYRNPAEDLPQDWEEHRAEHYRRLGIPSDARGFVDKIRADMEAELDSLNSYLKDAGDGDVAVRHPGGGERGVFYVPKLPKRPDRQILDEIKGRVFAKWGVLDLTDILVEADRQVDFVRFFVTSGQRQVIAPAEIRRRLLLVLFSLGTNIGLKRIHAASQVACSYDDLRYFRDRYVTVAAVRRAIAALVDRILQIRDPKVWGHATTCASDGKHIGAWDQNLVSEWNPHYGGRGIMVYWHVEKNSLCIHSKLKRPSSSEVALMIEGLVRHDTEMRVERNFVDSHGQSEVAFAFAYILDFALMPRLKRIKYERLYLPSKSVADRLPELAGVLARAIRWDCIEEQYDEIVRHVVAVQDGSTPIESILRRFNRYNRTHPTYKAIVELGKALKTIFLCRYLKSLELRQEVNEGLNVVENWNSVIDFIFFGRRSELNTNDTEVQELAILCLHLLQNAIILANTQMVQRVIDEDGLLERMDKDDRRAITPLFTLNVNPYGDFNLDPNKVPFLEAA